MSIRRSIRSSIAKNPPGMNSASKPARIKSEITSAQPALAAATGAAAAATGATGVTGRQTLHNPANGATGAHVG
jgi:hypothetical protein